jgi:hypothetical protein
LLMKLDSGGLLAKLLPWRKSAPKLARAPRTVRGQNGWAAVRQHLTAVGLDPLA